MSRTTGPDCAFMCNLITHTHTHLGGLIRVAYNDWDDRAGLRGYVLNKYTHTCTHTHTLERINASGIE